MKVSELRKALENMPDHLDVAIGYDGGPQESGEASEVKAFEAFDVEYVLIPEKKR
jgi:hypothetical protein